MAHQTKIKEIARLIELERKEVSLTLQALVNDAEIAVELKAIDENIESLKEKITAENYELIALPNQIELDFTENELFSKQEELKVLIKKRDPETVKLLEKRNKLARFVLDNRFEIAKLAVLNSKLDKEKQQAIRHIIQYSQAEPKNGKIEIGEEEISKKLARYLNRLGILCTTEKKSLIIGKEDKGMVEEKALPLANRNIYLGKNEFEKYERNKKELEKTVVQIQIKAAERQIKTFSKDEENEFSLLQKKYLTHLKEQDEILKDFISEED